MKNQKKAVFIFRSLGTGGAQKIEAFVANALADNDYQIYLINMDKSPCSVELNNEIKIINLYYEEKGRNKIEEVLSKIKYLLRLRRIIRKIGPDIVISFLSDVVRITVISMIGLNIPILGSERGDPTVFTDKQFKSYKKAYLKCKGVVFQIPQVKKMYSLPSKIPQATIPNPCVPRKGGFSKRENVDSNTIISAGRFTKQKRFDLLIQAFYITQQKHPEYRLVIYGDGSERTNLESIIKELKLTDKVVLAGDVDNVFDIGKDADFFVLSSDFEGIPNVLIEAMAIGIPCISTDCTPGGARFLLNEGELGLLVEKNNPVLLSQAIDYYIEHPQEKMSYGQKSKSIIDRFDPEIIKKQWLQFIDSI